MPTLSPPTDSQTRPTRRTFRRRISLALLAIALGGAALWQGQDALAEGLGPDRFTIRDFRSQGVREDGGVDWRLHGGTATGNAAQVDITDLEIVVYRNDDPILIRSPSARFDRVRNVATSGQPVHVRSSNMVATGIGFELDPGGHRLTVRQQVHIQIYKLPAESPARAGQ